MPPCIPVPETTHLWLSESGYISFGTVTVNKAEQKIRHSQIVCLHISVLYRVGPEETYPTPISQEIPVIIWAFVKVPFSPLPPSILGKSRILDLLWGSSHLSTLLTCAADCLPTPYYPGSFSSYGSNYIIICQILPPLTSDSNNNYHPLSSY